MAEWFSMYLNIIVNIATHELRYLSTGLGFSFGDVEIALMLIGLVASAFVAKFSHLGVRHDFTFGSGSGPKHNY